MLGTPNALNTYRGKNFKDNTMDNQQETNKNRILRDCTWSVEIILRRFSPILSNLAVLGDRSILAFRTYDGFLTIIRCLVFFILSLGLIPLNLNLDLLSTDNFSQSFGEVLLSLFVPFSKYKKVYNYPLNQRDLIREENKDKVGVYAWLNKVNNKIYIGSGDPLYKRLSDYYQDWYLSSRPSLLVIRARGALRAPLAAPPPPEGGPLSKNMDWVALYWLFLSIQIQKMLFLVNKSELIYLSLSITLILQLVARRGINMTLKVWWKYVLQL
uniref:GIY-YIG domain-containing protein n=1 Tax=Morchella importuna TaxID=1174673 RepID=A0A650AGC4_9PEZI|nr:hypothetical protein [Morchella importuna]QGN66759.1 hypothetical protein [Morchella importuna]